MQITTLAKPRGSDSPLPSVRSEQYFPPEIITQR